MCVCKCVCARVCVCVHVCVCVCTCVHVCSFVCMRTCAFCCAGSLYMCGVCGCTHAYTTYVVLTRMNGDTLHYIEHVYRVTSI